MALIVLAAGVYVTFFQSRGFAKTTAEIVDVRLDSTNESVVYYPIVEYVVGGKTYTAELDSGSSSYRLGQTLSIRYDPSNPSVVHAEGSIGLILMIVSGAILVVIIASAILEKRNGNRDGREVIDNQ